jgi:hypothetical protein
MTQLDIRRKNVLRAPHTWDVEFMRSAKTIPGLAPAATFHLELPERLEVTCGLITLPVLAAVSIAAVGVIVGLGPSQSWLGNVVGYLVALPLGLAVGIFCIAGLTQLVLHRMVPTHLVGTDAALRLRMWQTWDGIREGFRRIDVSISRADIRTVYLSRTQGERWQLFLGHVRGPGFYAGFTGELAQVEEYGALIRSWLDGAPVSQRIEERPIDGPSR